MSAQPSRWISLRSSVLCAEIDPLGAQLSALRDRDGRDLLWDGDPSVWSGRAPLLFPIVGALADGHYRAAGRSYALSRHGFARGKRFDLVVAGANAAEFRLTSDAETLRIYPFHFELLVRFELDGPMLSITTRVGNLGTTAMPASFGYHPAFRWPLPYGAARSDHFIEFAADEPGALRRLNANGLLAPEHYPTPISRRCLPLADALFQDDAMIFDQIRSRIVTYGAGSGPRIQVSYPDSPYLGLWAKPGARFVCIEPWNGVADPEGFSGEFDTKPGVFLVAPGARMPIKMGITLLEQPV